MSAHIKFEISGIDPKSIEGAIFLAAKEQIADELRQRVAGIRDPETGEFPLLVVSGKNLENLSVKVECSERIKPRVLKALGVDEEEPENTGWETQMPPHVFLCHASENKSLARQVAQGLMGNGVETFFDEWEIRAGDSIRGKIDQGLAACSHFIVLMTPEAIQKEWVQKEMDGGFVKTVNGQCTFIVLRVDDFPIDRLPLTLQGLHSPTISSSELELTSLIEDIFGTPRKPPLGTPPPSVSGSPPEKTLEEKLDEVCSRDAAFLAQWFVQHSQHGLPHDPNFDLNELSETTGRPFEDLEDGASELHDMGAIYLERFINGGPMVGARDELFVKFDSFFMPWDPQEDAVAIVEVLLGMPGQGATSDGLAAALGWEPRRFNPACAYLINRDLVMSMTAMGAHPYFAVGLHAKPETRRFLKSRISP